MEFKKTRKGSIGGHMLTEEQLTEFIEKSTVKASDKPVKPEKHSKRNGQE